MAAIVAVAAVPAHIVFIVGSLDDGEQLVILSIIDVIVAVQVFPTFQGQGVPILLGPDENQAVAFVNLVDSLFELSGAFGALERGLNIVQVDDSRGSVGGRPFIV